MASCLVWWFSVAVTAPNRCFGKLWGGSYKKRPSSLNTPETRASQPKLQSPTWGSRGVCEGQGGGAGPAWASRARHPCLTPFQRGARSAPGFAPPWTRGRGRRSPGLRQGAAGAGGNPGVDFTHPERGLCHSTSPPSPRCPQTSPEASPSPLSRAPMGAHLPLVPPASLLAPQQDLGAFM